MELSDVLGRVRRDCHSRRYRELDLGGFNRVQPSQSRRFCHGLNIRDLDPARRHTQHQSDVRSESVREELRSGHGESHRDSDQRDHHELVHTVLRAASESHRQILLREASIGAGAGRQVRIGVDLGHISEGASHFRSIKDIVRIRARNVDVDQSRFVFVWIIPSEEPRSRELSGGHDVMVVSRGNHDRESIRWHDVWARIEDAFITSVGALDVVRVVSVISGHDERTHIDSSGGFSDV